jgi:hypothetical protein
LVYWPSFTGHPVWDDLTFWFYDPVMSPAFPYRDIWMNFTWPLSVSLQKLLLAVLKQNWWAYHSINFLLHSLNSWLVYRLCRHFGLSLLWAFMSFAFFLLQPASVITVAWMIQLKTLVCFTFALSSLLLFLKARSKWHYLISVLLFFLSVVCKSSSLPLPIVLLLFTSRPWDKKKILFLIPFFVISLFGVYRLGRSSITTEGVQQAAHVTSITNDSVAAKEVKDIVDVEVPSLDLEDHLMEPVPDEPLKNAPEVSKKEEKPVTFLGDINTVLKTMYFYFWQAFLPLNTAPVKGLNPYPPLLQEYVHLMFILILGFLCFKSGRLILLISGHLFLLPYLGIIPAPFMNVTWVSDQHLYFSLPYFAILLFGFFDHYGNRWPLFFAVALLIFFGVKTAESSRYYENNTTFYEASVQSNFNNVPIIYNLCVIYLSEGKTQKAIDLLNTIISISKEESSLRKNPYYPYLVQLHSRFAGQ